MCTPSFGDGDGFYSVVADKPGGGASKASANLIEELALANRILYREGVVDGFGHASLR